MIKRDAMKKESIIMMIIVITVAFLAVAGCGRRDKNDQELRIEQKRQKPAKIKQSVIAYEILRKWDIRINQGVGMDLLVSPRSTKQEVMTLARHLKNKYLSRNKYVWINIFDSKKAYLHRDDMSYPQAEYWKHFLVQIDLSNKVMWVAKGRSNI